MSLPPPSPKQASLIWAALTGLALTALVAMVVALVWGLGKTLDLLSPVLWPLAVAGVLAYLLDPVVDFLVRRRVSRQRAILLVFGLALMIVAAFFGSIVPQLVIETRQLAEKVPTYATRVQKRFEGFVSHPPKAAQWLLNLRQGVATVHANPDTNTVAELPVTPVPPPSATNPPPLTNPPPAVASPASSPAKSLFQLDKELVQSISAWAAGFAPKLGRWLLDRLSAAASWLGIIAGLALIPVYTFYFLLEKRGIERNWTEYLPVGKSGFKDELVFVLTSINDYLIVFFRGQVLVAFCDGVLYTIGFFCIGLNYAFLLGGLATVLTMIPFLGAIATFLLALVLAFAQFGDWFHPLLVLGVFAVVQTLEGLFISPKILGDRVGLHPLAIIIAVMVGTTLLGGLLGGILAIPLTAALRVVMARYVWKRE